MPRRRGQHNDAQHENDEVDMASLTPEQRAVEFLRRAMRSNSHWRPSMAMAKCLGVTASKLSLTSDKNDTTNLVWVTVLVILYCVSQLPDFHELWYELADPATAWLYGQPHFVDNREDLVTSAGALLGVRDVSNLLASVFPEPKDPETMALEAALGDWKICYLDQPPYTMYYWNEKTNLSTWRNPLETAQLEKERLEKKKQRDDLQAKVLPMRVRINRDRKPPQRDRQCDECSASTQQPSGIMQATVCCVPCGGRYFCNLCCDRIHCEPAKIAHIATGFRFRECVGVKGFPTEIRIVELPKLPHQQSDGSYNIESA